MNDIDNLEDENQLLAQVDEQQDRAEFWEGPGALIDPTNPDEFEDFLERQEQEGDIENLKYPDQEEITWGEAIQGLNLFGWPPWENVFWQSFVNNSKDIVVGLPQLPGLVFGLAKEIPNIYHLPGILAGNLGEGEAFISALEDKGMPILAAMIGDYQDVYGSLEGFKSTLATDPVRIITDLATAAVPVGAAVGGTARALKFSSRLGKVANTLEKTGKVISKIGRGTDKVFSAPAIGAQKVVKKGLSSVKKQFAMDPDSYNKKFTISTGVWDEATGEYVKQTITPIELAQRLSERAGFHIDPKDLPIQVITDNEIPILFEEILRKTEEDIAPTIAAEYDAASDLVKAAQEGVEKTKRIDKEMVTSYKNPYKLGQHLQEYYKQMQRAERGQIGGLYTSLKSDFDTPIKQLRNREFYQLFRRTNEFIEELVEPYEAVDFQNINGKMQIVNIDKITNPDIRKTVQAYQDILVKKLSELDNPTYNTVRTARTDFGDQANVFARQGEILAVGEGSVSSKIYKLMSRDIRAIVEQGIKDKDFKFGHDELFDNLTEELTDKKIDELAASNPDWADWKKKHYVIEHNLRIANNQYAKWLDLEDSNAGKWFRENVRDPGAMLDQVLAKDSVLVGDEIQNMKDILDHRWPTFQAALLNRLFEKSMSRGENVTPLGLKTILANINNKDKNRLADLLNTKNSNVAKMLHEIAEFRERVFGPKGKWNTPYAQQIIGKYLKDPDFTNILLATGMMSDATAQAFQDAARHSNRIVDIPALQYIGAINIAIMGALIFPKQIAKKKLISGGYKDWMTDGYKGLRVPLRVGPDNKTMDFVINADTFADLEYLVNKYGWQTFYPGRVASRTKQNQKQREERKITPPTRVPDTGEMFFVE